MSLPVRLRGQTLELRVVLRFLLRVKHPRSKRLNAWQKNLLLASFLVVWLDDLQSIEYILMFIEWYILDVVPYGLRRPSDRVCHWYMTTDLNVWNICLRWMLRELSKQIWLVVWNMSYFPIYWEESSQLTNIVSEGFKPPTSHQMIQRHVSIQHNATWGHL